MNANREGAVTPNTCHSSRRYSEGGRPTSARNFVLKDPTLVYPTATQASVTEYVPDANNSLARPIRIWVRKSCGVAANTDVNRR